VPAVSLSKTKNVPKLTSAISSSLRVICGGAPSRGGVSEVATAAVACVPPTSDKAPTTPTTGTACFRCFRFDVLLLFGIEASHALDRDFDARGVIRTPCIATVQDRLHRARWRRHNCCCNGGVQQLKPRGCSSGSGRCSRGFIRAVRSVQYDLRVYTNLYRALRQAYNLRASVWIERSRNLSAFSLEMMRRFPDFLSLQRKKKENDQFSSQLAWQ